MALRIAVHPIAGHGKAQLTCAAMAEGIRQAGDLAFVRSDTEYREPDCDAVVFWGYIETCQKIMKDYRAQGKPVVYLDMGYWQREGNVGFFKVAVNARHPTDYFQHVKHNDSRARMFGVVTQPWREGGKHILLAGMSAKAAWAEKLEPAESFERMAIKAIRNVTDRPIVYRPKPSWKDAKPIDGTRYSPKAESLASVLKDAHAVVTHHSNVAVDGLVAGVPAFVWDGVAVPVGTKDLRFIENPNRPDRGQWISDVAYTQWSMNEMRQGLVWRHLKDEGLV